MSEPQEATCRCNICDAEIHFEQHQAGGRIPCPHCGMETLLFIPQVTRKVSKEIEHEPVCEPPPNQGSAGAPQDGPPYQNGFYGLLRSSESS